MRHRTITVVAVLVCLVAVAAGCEPFKDSVPEGKAPLRYRDAVFTSVTKTEDVTYGSAPAFDGSGDVALKLDVYQPKGDTATGRPLLVFVHGGGFASLDKTSGEIVDQANVFAKKGYVVVSIDYRLDDVGCSKVAPACITAIKGAQHDAQAAVRYLRKRHVGYRIDQNRIAIGGSSAGAITATNVAFAGSDVGTSGSPGTSSKVAAAVSLSGAAITTRPDKGESPVLFFHGTKDTLVPYVWMSNTRADAEKAGVHTELTTWDGGGHVPYVEHRTQILDQTTNFLYHELDLSHAGA